MVGRGIENGVLEVAPKYPQEYSVFVSLGPAELRNSNVHFFFIHFIVLLIDFF